MKHLPLTALVVLLASCGGGGGGGGGSTTPVHTGGDLLSVAASASATPVPSATNTDIVVTASNPGSVAAQSVKLSLSLGAGLSLAGVTCTATGASCPANTSSLSIDSLPAGGSVRFTISVIAASGMSGAIASSITGSASNDSDTANNTAQVSIDVYSFDLRVAGSTTASEFMSGATVPYALTISNVGPDAAKNVTLDNILSRGQTFSALTCSASGGAVCPTSLAPSMTIASIPVGGALDLKLTATLDMDALVSVGDTISVASLGDSVLTNNRTTVAASTRIPTSPTMPSFVKLRSDVNDWIGLGQDYSYSQQNAVFEVYESPVGELHFNVHGDQNWQAVFQTPAAGGQITPGTYIDAAGWPGNNPATGGLSWNGEGRGCTHQGWFVVDDVVYTSGQLSSIDLRFEQHCEGGAPALRGQVHWYRDDSTRPPGPVNPIPAGLWTPPASAIPPGINYVYLESDGPQDFIGQGFVGTYTQANAVLTVNQSGGQLTFDVTAENGFGGGFKAMSPLTSLEPGYYTVASVPPPYNNPSEAGMGIGGNSHVCMYVEGWFAVDNIVYLNGSLVAVDLRFEQHCDGRGALRGSVHWRSGDTTQPPGPQYPPPAGLWAPPAAAVPATGNFVYLEGDVGDFISGGGQSVYTPLNSVITVGGGGITPASNRFQLTVQGDQQWTGFFQAMNTLIKLAPGYYPDLRRFAGANNPAKGSLDWSGEGRACNALVGWFVIDDLTYSGDTLTSIDLRFEQHCEGSAPALHGRVRWSAADTRVPPGPVNPPPAGLWSPPAGATPANGNYFYQESEPGEFIGAGATHLYTSTDALFQMTVTGAQLNVLVHGDLRWSGYFTPMVPRQQLEPGLYADLTSQSIAKGTFFWSGDGRGCTGGVGWFVVDQVSYAADAITSLDLRFEQRCAAGKPALHGKLHWRADDTAQPPGPVNPPPANLWAPPVGATPATGNFFYLQSGPGDFIGGGKTVLITAADASFDAGTLADGFIVGAQNSATGLFWTAHFDHMFSIARLEPGYYPNAQQNLLHNPARGGMSITGNSRACNTSTGWFAIDSISFSGNDVASIDVRFEQHCEGATAALRGRIRWAR